MEDWIPATPHCTKSPRNLYLPSQPTVLNLENLNNTASFPFLFIITIGFISCPFNPSLGASPSCSSVIGLIVCGVKVGVQFQSLTLRIVLLGFRVQELRVLDELGPFIPGQLPF